jgi:hypothetical protein
MPVDGKSGVAVRPQTRLALLRDAEIVAIVLEVPPGDDLSCTERPWLGDLNGDGEIDVVFRCTLRTYDRWIGVSISDPNAPGKRRLVIQRATGGSV